MAQAGSRGASRAVRAKPGEFVAGAADAGAAVRRRTQTSAVELRRGAIDDEASPGRPRAAADFAAWTRELLR